jgi:hypothetical protein
VRVAIGDSTCSKASEINRNNLRSTKKKGSTNGSPCFQLPSLFRKKMQASSVIIGKKLKIAWLNRILLKQCLGWQLLGERH